MKLYYNMKDQTIDMQEELEDTKGVNRILISKKKDFNFSINKNNILCNVSGLRSVNINSG